MTEEAVGWLTGPRSGVYHRDQEDADALTGDGGLYPVTEDEVRKFGLRECSRCSTPKIKPPPENVVATAGALRSMFVVEGTEAEVIQMAQDFILDLAKFGFSVYRIPRRKNTTDTSVTEYFVDVTVGPGLDTPLDFASVLDAESTLNEPTVQQEDTEE